MSPNPSFSTPAPFEGFFSPSIGGASELRQAIAAATRLPEPQAVVAVLQAARLPADLAERSRQLARRLAGHLRERHSGGGRSGLVQSLLQEYALSSQEGVALMCLAEALLRIPDAATRDALIRDKIAQGQWHTHLGKSPSLFVNAATWGLLITGKLVATHSESGLVAALARLMGLGGEPLIRKGVDRAMRLMGEQFITGQTIGQALGNAAEREKQGFRYSFDMLGEAAMTAADADRYLRSYEAAIHAIGQASAGRGVYGGPGISIKLSALHPRYSRSQYERVMRELYPVLLRLCALAKRYDIGLNIDAEETDRLELSLDLLEGLCLEPQLQGWQGLGFVIQAYQKRCPAVVDWVIDLARRSRRRLMIRLVKGAYWDAEIKRAQMDGLADYPVYTRKAHTDLSYVACARQLLAAPDAVYPQFATHNAHTLAAVYEMADPGSWHPQQYEFQCLHGMGEPLYEQVVPGSDGVGRPCRVYAPVGTHETLLAYLVRRLLENGANTSFVHRMADTTLSLDELVRDPLDQVEEHASSEGALGLPHPAIALPRDLYGPTRANSCGMDLANEQQLAELMNAFAASRSESFQAMPMLAHDVMPGQMQSVSSPACASDIVGQVSEATLDDIELALQAATAGAASWAATSPVERARMLEAAAQHLQDDAPRLMALLIREAGKTAANAVAEVREAVDFLRYYACQAREQLNAGNHRPWGPVACISPWNFPLAIFMGQVAAALAAGNVVLAKPAEQTPLMAARAVGALWAAGVPRRAVQLLPGRGEVVGARLVTDARIQGVLFTGSTEVARILQRSVVGRVHASGRTIPLIAETGGQNAMIVDSSALPEQVVADVLASAFDSAGQRCSALRVLCVQQEAADRILEMLLGALAELRVGRPDRLSTDLGPVIDADAKAGIERHIQAMRDKGHRVHQFQGPSHDALHLGTFVLPTVIELHSVCELGREVFGPVLHVVRYRRDGLDDLLAQIKRTGYGLTMGLHTRIDETIAHVAESAHVGNLYVNRNMVGAVVGVQPFGGEGLSGTGPKAGGPLYLYRLLSQTPAHVLDRIMGGQGRRKVLPGPTGERNVYSLVPRSGVLCLAENDADRLAQLAAVCAAGARVIWPASAAGLLACQSKDVQSQVALVEDWTAPEPAFDLVLLHGSAEEMAQVQAKLSHCEGAVVSVERLEPGQRDIPLERLFNERAMSINTAAAGGNASLMTMG